MGRRVADFSERRHGIVLKGTVELRHVRNCLQRIGPTVVAKGVDERAAKIVLPPHDERQRRGAGARVITVRGERAQQRRPHEFRLLSSERVNQGRQHREVAMMLEPGVGHHSQPIVAVGHDLPHHVGG